LRPVGRLQVIVVALDDQPQTKATREILAHRR
jgi:hypothetical protein